MASTLNTDSTRSTIANTRNSNIEVLRFVLMASIFLWHIIMHGCGFRYIGHSEYGYNIHVTIILCALFVPSVNCFMFISGWFGMNFKARKAIQISLICILSAALCLVLKRYTFLGGGKSVTLQSLYKALFPISTKAWWFMTGYMMVYLISPFIEKGLNTLQNREILYILCFMTLIEVLGLPVAMNWGSDFFGLLYIYMIGRIMRLYKKNLRLKQSCLLYISMTLSIVTCMEMVFHFLGEKSLLFWFLQFNNPLIIVQAIAIFFMVRDLPATYNRSINWLFRPCLCIYLLTEWTQPYKSIVSILEKDLALGILTMVISVLFCLLVGQLIFLIADIMTQAIKKISLYRLNQDS